MSRAWESLRRTILAWLRHEPPTSLRMGRPPAVLICYECRRRVTPQEIAAGLHDHTRSSAAAAGSQASEQ